MAHVPDPETYASNLGRCKAFLLPSSLMFAQHPLTNATEEPKVAYIMGLQRVDALACATAVWGRQPTLSSSISSFTDELWRVFDQPVQGQEAAKQSSRVFSGVPCPGRRVWLERGGTPGSVPDQAQ